MPYCYICNRTVEIVTVNESPEYEESVFSCGHTSKLFKRSITEGLRITENVQVTPEKGEKIPVTVSGDTGVKIQGNLNRIDVLIEQNKPTYYNIKITNVNASKTDISQNILQTNTINNIVANLDQSSLSTDAKRQVHNLINEFDQEAKLPKPDHHKLKSILSKIFPVATDIGLMLLKYGLDHGLLSGSTIF
jgi:hypothetical protein